MTRFLIFLVEDEPELSEQLPKLLEESIEGLRVESARSVSEATKMLEAMLSSGRQPDLAILDFSLPLAPGENPSIDMTLCRRIREEMNGTLVGHITAHGDEKLVKDHIEAVHDPEDPAGFIVHKDGTWAPEFVLKCSRALYGRPIMARMRELFGETGGEQTAYLPSIRRSDDAQPDVSMALADLENEISQSWTFLSEVTKRRVRRHFHIDDTKTPVAVHLK